MNTKRRILFVAENVTLAQCVRLVTLARALDGERFEVHFACSEFPALIFAKERFVRHPISSLAPEAAARALEAGQRLYEKSTLLRYIDAERRLLEAVAPELVVGDFRLSLSTSAELMGVPSAVLINAYWSPFARRSAFPVPDHPIIGWLGEALTERYFPRAMPHVFRHFASPINAARAQHGLAPVGSLLEVLTHGTFTLYPDDAALTPVDSAPSNHRFIGPVLWQPDLEDELGASGSADPSSDAAARRLLESGRPLIYVTLGSSGSVGLLPQVIEALAGLPVVALVATAGRAALAGLPANVVARPFVRGADVAARAVLVISNGGSTTGYQALSRGTPVLGLPSNFDQHLATEAIDRSGAGLSVKARQADVRAIRSALDRALGNASLGDAARRVAQGFARYDSPATFRALVDELGTRPASSLRGSNAS
ncbi:MAG TPA: nucleotide disphospho-sugar-binding domain-containing protein [Polyangiaceae bacterium]|nr:nucleotide disphospho-sugar-binding domain-containing protein [Polyangiaceae bacterium]